MYVAGVKIQCANIRAGPGWSCSTDVYKPV